MRRLRDKKKFGYISSKFVHEAAKDAPSRYAHNLCLMMQSVFGILGDIITTAGIFQYTGDVHSCRGISSVLCVCVGGGGGRGRGRYLDGIGTIAIEFSATLMILVAALMMIPTLLRTSAGILKIFLQCTEYPSVQSWMFLPLLVMARGFINFIHCVFRNLIFTGLLE